MTHKQDVLFLSMARYYNDLPLCLHDIAHLLAKDRRVIWVDPPPLYVSGPLHFLIKLGALTVVHRITRAGSSGRSAAALPSVQLRPPPIERHKGIEIVRLRHLPFHANSLRMSRINQAFEARQLAELYAELGLRDPIVVSCRYDSDVIIRRLRASRRVYYCLDYWEDFPWAYRRIVRAQERSLVRVADLTIAVTDELAAKMEARGARAVTVRNGVDYDLFTGMAADRRPSPPELEGIAGPVVGFIGSLASWVDLDLLEGIASARPDWTFLLIGPAAGTDVRPLARLGNVIMPGVIARENLAPYMRHIDVTLIPFRMNDITRSASPLKLYEYLAAHKPVVSTPLPEALRCSPPVFVAEGVRPFIEAIEAALIPSQTREEAGLQVAADASWIARTREFERYLDA